MNFKKFISSISALAIAASAFAGLAVTASAADVVYERTASTWAETDVSDSEWSGGTVTEGTGLVISYNNSGAEASKSIASLINANDLVEFTGTWITGGANGRSGSYDYVGFGSSLQLQDNTQDNQVYISVNGVQTTIISSNTRSQTYTFDVIVDTATKTLTQFKVDGTDYISALSNTTLNDTVSTLVLGHYKAGREGYASSTTLSAIKVETTAQEATTVDYTVKYVDADGNELKDSVTRTNVVGAEVSATTDDTEDFDKDGVRYSFNAEDSTDSITLGETAANNIITLVFDAHAATTVPVTAKAGDTEIATYDAIATYIDYPYSFGPYAYIKYGNDYYKYDGIAADGSVPAVTGTATSTSSIVLNYTKADDVVWYTEVDANNYSGHSPFATSADDANASGGKNGGSVYGQADARINVGTFTAEAAGKYKVTYNALSTPSKTRSCYFAIDTTNTEEATLDACDNGEFKTFEHEVHLTTGDHEIYIISNGGAGFYVDYMAIELVEVDSTPATASINHIQDFTSETETDAEASLWEMTVTAGTDAITSVDVTVDGQASEGAITGTPVIASGTATFGIVINKLQDAITSIKAVINGVAID
ncbi:MAG: hypothetical protein ACI4EA_10685 [Candidatus Ornithomonoglobus sp.]